MKIEPQKNYAVITGDFIGFSGLPVEIRQRMYFVMKEGGKELSKVFPGILPCEIDVFRGDGWQTLINDPVLSLRAALFIRAYVRSWFLGKLPEKGSGFVLLASGGIIDTRLAIGVGFVDYVPENRAAAGDGPAFRRSGKLLEQMASPMAGTIRFAADEVGDEQCRKLLDEIALRIGNLADQWNPEQALAITGWLRGWTHSQIARLWPNGIAPETVEQYLQKAGLHVIRHGLSVFENALKPITA
jgi:hypothetical protein